MMGADEDDVESKLGRALPDRTRADWRSPLLRIRTPDGWSIYASRISTTD